MLRGKKGGEAESGGGWHGGGASYEGAALAVPMTRLQITPQREQGRTKRKKRQRAPSVTPIGRERLTPGYRYGRR